MPITRFFPRACALVGLATVAASCLLDAYGPPGSSGDEAECGNGLHEIVEGCDDGNHTPGDGCGAWCNAEDPNQCFGAPISLGKGSLTISDTTTGATDKVTRSAYGNCGAEDRDGSDLIYAVSPGVDGLLRATLVAAYQNHFLHIRMACPGSDFDEIACDFDFTSGVADVNEAYAEVGKTYYVIVDGHAGDSGPFTLTLELF